ncbi:hemagglutinin repeat-containing protein, partial [bacterium]|nr:hemagglutinin repeat-containing protein [bacterium]
LLAATDVGIDAGGNIDIESSEIEATAGEMDIDAGDNIMVSRSDLTAGTTLTATAGNNVDMLATTVTAGDNIFVEATTGNVVLNTVEADATLGEMDITAGDNILVVLSTLTAGTDVTLDAENDVDIFRSEITAGENVTIAATNGSIDIESSEIEATAGEMDIDAGDNIMVSRSDLTAGTTLTATAGNSVDMLTSNLLAGEDVTITATAGYVNMESVDIDSTTGAIDVVAATDVDITDSTLLASIDIGIDAGGNIDIESSEIEATAGEMDLTAGVDIMVSRSELTAGTTLTATAGENVDILKSDITAVDANINALNGYVNLNTVDIQAGNDINIYAKTNVDIITNTLLTAGNDIGVIAEDGYIRICLDSFLNAGNDVYLDAGTDIVICENAAVFAGGDATLVAGEDVYLGYIEAGNAVDITAGGSIFDNNDDRVNILAKDVVLSAVNGIGTADAIETQAETLSAENTTSGDIWVRNNTLVAGDLEVLGVTNSAPGGMVRLENGYIRFDNCTLNDIDYATGGDMLLAGTVEADGKVMIQTIGSILDRNDVTPYDVIATDTSGMFAFNGTIGEFDGNPDGSGYNPVEVNINPGDLYVYASDESFFVSVGIDGIVQPRDVLLACPNLPVSPGLIFFNGRENGGMRSPQWFRAVSPSIIMIGSEDTFWLEVLLNLLDYRWTELGPAFWEFDEELDDALDYIISKR